MECSTGAGGINENKSCGIKRDLQLITQAHPANALRSDMIFSCSMPNIPVPPFPTISDGTGESGSEEESNSLSSLASTHSRGSAGGSSGYAADDERSFGSFGEVSRTDVTGSSKSI
jgi:hypothetical protein